MCRVTICAGHGKVCASANRRAWSVSAREQVPSALGANTWTPAASRGYMDASKACAHKKSAVAREPQRLLALAQAKHPRPNGRVDVPVGLAAGLSADQAFLA